MVDLPTSSGFISLWQVSTSDRLNDWESRETLLAVLALITEPCHERCPPCLQRHAKVDASYEIVRRAAA